jgi:hypothetical protein
MPGPKLAAIEGIVLRNAINTSIFTNLPTKPHNWAPFQPRLQISFPLKKLILQVAYFEADMKIGLFDKIDRP